MSVSVSPLSFRRVRADSGHGQAYDGHMNMVLSDVEETVYLVDIDQQTQQNVVRVRRLSFPCDGSVAADVTDTSCAVRSPDGQAKQ